MTTSNRLTMSAFPDQDLSSLENLGCTVHLEDELCHVDLPTDWWVVLVDALGLRYVVDAANRPRAVFNDDYGLDIRYLGVFEHTPNFKVEESSSHGENGRGSVCFVVTDGDSNKQYRTRAFHFSDNGEYHAARARALEVAWSIMIQYPWT